MKRSTVAYMMLTLVVLLQTVVYLLNSTSLAGYWPDKVPVWLWVLLTPVFIYRHFRYWPAKLYTGALVILLLISFVPFALPFVYFASFFCAADRTFSQEIHEGYRIQGITRSPMVGETIEVVKTAGLLEKHWNLGPNDDDTTYQLPDNVSLSLKSTPIRNLAILRLPGRAIEIALP